MFNIGCYVTSRYKSYNTFSEYMDGCIKKFLPVGKPSALVTGDYKSTNSGNGLVARYAFEHNIPLRRFSTMWGKHNPSKPGKKNNAGVASNAQIIKNSNGCVLFWTPTSVAKWDFMSGGCRSFLRMCDEGHLARPLIKIKVDIYAPDTEKPLDNTMNDTGTGSQGIPNDTSIGSDINNYRSMVGEQPKTVSTGGGGVTPLSLPIGGNTSAPVTQQSAAIGDISTGNDANIAQEEISSGDNIGNIDVGTENIPQTANSIISQIPVDTDGDGNLDTTVTAIDTDMNGSPDAIVTTVDSDNNGTIDSLELTPMPTVGQITSQNTNNKPVVAQQTSTTVDNISATNNSQLPTEDEEQK